MENAKKLFIKAFMEAETLDNAEIPNEDEIEWAFSDKFLRKMDKLIKKNNRVRLSTRRTVTKGLIAAIIAIIVVLAGLMSVAAIRKPIVEFVKKVFPQFNEITLGDGASMTVDTIETEYTLTNLPEGYELDTYQKDDFSVFAVWKNDAGEEIIFMQNVLDSNFTIDNENTYRELEINGLKAYWIEDEYSGELRWSDGYYWFTVRVPAYMKNDIMTLQKNIFEKN